MTIKKSQRFAINQRIYKRNWLQTELLCLLMTAALLTGCSNPDQVYANPPKILNQFIEQILPKAESFVLESQSEALANGQSLDDAQLKLAVEIGVKHPEKVRLYYVQTLPAPKDPQLNALAKQFGYTAPLMAAATHGYGIWIKRPFKANKILLAHELVHVRQAEQMGLQQQIKQYLLQLVIYGYNKAPMELEAYKEEKQYVHK